MPTREYAFGAGETKHLGGGNRLRLLVTSSPVTVRFFKNGTEIVSETAEEVEAGFLGAPPREGQGLLAFDDVTVESPAAQTVKIFTTRGESRYDRSVGDVNATPVRPTVAETTADEAVAATATEQVLAADADRHEAIVTNLVGNASEVRVGDANTAAARGIPLQPGESITLKTTAAIYVYNSDAAPQSVALLELKA